MASRTIYLDVSELLARKLHTGIQRVVRQIARASLEAAPEFGAEVVPVVTVGSNVYALTTAGTASLLDPPAVSYSVPVPSEKPSRKLLRQMLLLFPPLYSMLQRAYVRSKLAGLHLSVPIRFSSRDAYVLLGSFWGGSSTVDAAAAAGRDGCAIVPVIYDLIPITHPEFCEDQNVRAFCHGFSKLLQSATGLVTISKYCVTEIEAFLASQNRCLPVDYFYLGADLDNRIDAKVEPVTWPAGLRDSNDRIYAMVGTIEPRKGHATVLDAFERLWAAGSQNRLLVIGKVGWAMEAFMTRTAVHPELGKRLFLVHTATDAMLADAYRFAHAAIIASSVEGFGLPLVEALHQGLPVIAADIPVFREIGSDRVAFFPLGDASELADVLTSMDGNFADHRQAAACFDWINWQDSARQFLTSVDAVISRHLQSGIEKRLTEPAQAG